MEPFPEAKRVYYKKNSIHLLTCDCRFPQILKINETEPVDFQEKIRDKELYPIYKKIVGRQGQVTIDINPLTESEKISHTLSKKVGNHQFTSIDNNWCVNLNNTSLSIATRKYENWEHFSQQLNTPLKAFENIYKPSFYERIGLKYIDIIQKSKLNLEGTNWSDLIQPHAIGYFTNPQLTPHIKNYNCTAEIDIGEGATAQIQTYLANISEMRNNISIEPELALIIVSDLFIFNKKIEEVHKNIDYLHSIAYRLFRSLITDKLHNAMEPEET